MAALKQHYETYSVSKMTFLLKTEGRDDDKKLQRTCTSWTGEKNSKFTHLHGGLEYSYILPLAEKTMTPTCASQRMASSFAFLSSPIRLLEKVTWRLVVFSIFLSSTFPRPIDPVLFSTAICQKVPVFIQDENQVLVSNAKEEMYQMASSAGSKKKQMIENARV